MNYSKFIKELSDVEYKEVAKEMQMAEKHWDWIEGLLEAMPDSNVWSQSTLEYIYKTAFVHGYKHADREGK